MSEKIILKRGFLESIVASGECASRDLGRYTLRHVLIDFTGANVLVVATNGYAISTHTHEVETSTVQRFLVSPEQLNLFKHILKEFKRNTTFEANLCADSLILMYGFQLELKSAKALSIIYPDYKQFTCAPSKKPVLTVGVDVEHLYSLMQALRIGKETKVKLVFVDGVDKIEVIPHSNLNARGLLMPYRV